MLSDDETKSNVAKEKLNLIGSATLVNHNVYGGTIDKEEDEDEEDEDEEWAPEGQGSNRIDDESDNKEDERTKVYTHLSQFIILACGFAQTFTC